MKAKLNRSVAVLGTGSYLPENVVCNAALEDLIVGYDKEKSGDFSTWVDRVTHIHERRYIADETVAVMGTMAAREALDMAGVKATDLDLIILASFTSSSQVPGDHVLIAKEIGADATPSTLLTAACAGSVQAMAMAYGMLASGCMRRVMVIGSETISPTLDHSDPLTSILFGDGAGAVVMGTVPESDGGMLAPNLGHEFNWENITMTNINVPFLAKVREEGSNGVPPAIEKSYLKMISGPRVLRNAVNTMAGCVRGVLGYDNGEDDPGMADTMAGMRLVPHQANGRIVDGLRKKLGARKEKTTKTVFKVGNLSAASNMIALDYAMRNGNYRADVDEETGKIHAIHEVRDPIAKGELVVLPTIGAGYLYGAVGFVHVG
ncbi:MAG: 3-oxoacyl-ACP synthase III family protein [Planctomycetota bacterium]|jgi:3-oxoacyl-[acyl-carrier-protein] synthase-3